jgi:hypothetical protein
MGAVQSEDVANKSDKRVLLTSCAGIRNSAVVWPKANRAWTAAEHSRDNSGCAHARMPQSPVQLLSRTSHFSSKLNRQTPEAETTLTPRKQRSANCSNRQKIQFCKSQNLRSTSANACPEPLSRRLAHRVFLKRNPPISNRELLVLEILQRAENKHRLTVLIENFEPNDSRSFRAFVAAAFRRATFACESPIRAGESAKPEGRSK